MAALTNMLSPSFTTSYGMAHFGKSLLWHCSEMVFIFFLTEACGLAPLAATTIVATSLFLNAAMDGVVGRCLSLRVKTIAIAGRLQMAGGTIAVPAFVSFAATGLLYESFRIPFAIIALFIFRLSYPVIDVCQNAMLALATDSDAGRARLSSLRYIYGGAADLVVATAFAPLLIGYPPATLARHFLLLSGVIAIIATAGGTVLLRALVRDPSPIVRGVLNSGLRDIALSERPAKALGFWIFPAITVLSLLSAAFGKLIPYISAFMFPEAASAASLPVGIVLTSIVSQRLWARWAALTSLKSVFIIAAMLTTVSGVVLLTTGIGDGASLCAFIATYGAGMGGLRMSVWAFAAARAGPRPDDGFSTFGLLTAFSKTGIASGTLAAGLLLASADYHNASAWQYKLLPSASFVPLALGLIMVTLKIAADQTTGKQRGSKSTTD